MPAVLGHPKKHVLDREAFIRSGLRLALNSAATSLTYRDIGKDLGVDATAIYRHFRTREDFFAALLDRILQQVVEQTKTPVAQWKQRLVEFALHTLQTFRTYPPIAAVAGTVTTRGPGELACMELMLECFARAGLSGAELAGQYARFVSYVISSSTGLARENLDGSASSSPAWFAGELVTDPGRHRLTSALQDEILKLDNESLFLAGAAQIIDAATAKGHHLSSTER
ncbi:TetR/AcrR family transcriptional regulator [Glutamicibacter sp.]|uniref:TetR/AcrR family transcriptional regulator n=1 Tax=Glutamicibacter sp. TaxID=1931995 RepID=UPI0028BE1116|nr:TetR/AcrR family transcriptional regulator [Glutamicibacter sp.]